MLDLKFVRENPELVKENIIKKFQNEKLVLVDEVLVLDKAIRALKQETEVLRAKRNQDSQKIGQLMREKQIEEATKMRQEVSSINERITVIEKELAEKEQELKKRMMVIPNIMIHRFQSVKMTVKMWKSNGF